MNGYFLLVRTVLGILILLCIAFKSQSQSSIEEHLPTRKVNKKIVEDSKKNRPKKTKYMYIYKRRTINTLYGNPCALSVTRKMGFEYLAQETSKIDLKSYWGRFFHNFWTKTKLVATRGPWWKITLNKRLKDCRTTTGDRTG